MLQRRQQNKITRINSQQGEKLQTKEEIEQELTHYYKDLLTEPRMDRSEATSKILQHIPTIISQDQNISLTQSITLQEVEEAVMDMNPGKAPGPDGFTMNFFQACWDTVKWDLWKVVEDSHHSGLILPVPNSTFLTLIPKVDKPAEPASFRPIALCNVIYKIITKFIANRLKPILPSIISQE